MSGLGGQFINPALMPVQLVSQHDSFLHIGIGLHGACINGSQQIIHFLVKITTQSMKIIFGRKLAHRVLKLCARNEHVQQFLHVFVVQHGIGLYNTVRMKQEPSSIKQIPCKPIKCRASTARLLGRGIRGQGIRAGAEAASAAALLCW